MLWSPARVSTLRLADTCPGTSGVKVGARLSGLQKLIMEPLKKSSLTGGGCILILRLLLFLPLDLFLLIFDMYLLLLVY